MSLGRSARLVACCATSALVFGLIGMAPASAESSHSRHGSEHSDHQRDSDNGHGHDSDHDHNHGDHHGHHHGNGAIFVSPTGTSSADGTSCDSATFSSINAAVTAAPTGGTVIVCPGTYMEDVLVNKALTLKGEDATIDATNLENGVQVVASDVTVEGLAIENANGEGVLVGVDAPTDAALLPASGPVLSDVTVQDVEANNNDKGFNGTESGNCKYPGDCGGGIHLNVTTHSVVKDNVVDGNSDGILLTDDYGPNSYNLVEGNVVDGNLSECGIVLPSHNVNAATYDPSTFAVTSLNPTLGGVFGNTVRDNIADGNGTNPAPPAFGGGGSGSGIGLFGSTSGTAVYNNVVEDNEASGNGLAGITIHAHHPGGEFLDGNSFVHNDLGTNNTGGDGFDGPPTTDFQTTGIAVFSVPTVHMTIAHNRIHDDAIGIWLSTTVTADGLNHNHYHHVTTDVVTG